MKCRNYMSLKNWPYWIRTGLIFAGLGFALILITEFIIKGFGYSAYVNIPIIGYLDLFLKIPGQILLSPTSVISECIYQSDLGVKDYSWCPKRSTLDLAIYLGTLIIYFLIGAIIGLIYKKIISRK